MVKLKCLGGFREVGKNGVLIEGKKEKFLFEYGFKIEDTSSPIKPHKKPDAIFITHGHLDHFGSVPELYKKWNVPIYGTEPTKEFAELLLKDSLKIGKLNKNPRNFSEKDIKKVLKNWKNISYNKKIKIGSSTVEVYDAGHVPGSAMYVLNIDGKKILYTGDINLSQSRTVNKARTNFKKIDLAIMETTYSSREHVNRKKEEKELGDIIKKTINHKGIAVVPSFASRAAELLLILQDQKIKAPIYLDGMAKKMCKIMLNHPRFSRHSIKLKKALLKAKNIYRHPQRTEILKKPCVIVTTGGCMDGGPIVHYLKHLYSRENCSLILTGFQIPGTAGRYLIDTGRYVANGMDLKLKMQIYKLDFSGHAGRSDLINFVKKIKPKKVICMHGDYTERFATELRGRFNIEAIAPKNGDTVTV